MDLLGSNAQENANKIEIEALRYVFKVDRDIFPRKPYDQEGDPEMYTAANMEKRKALRNSVLVTNAIEKFANESFQMTPGKVKTVSKEEYFKVLVTVGMILRPGIDSDELTQKIKEDFDSDSMDKSEAEGGDNQPPKI